MRIIRDVIGSQKLIPCTLYSYTFVLTWCWVLRTRVTFYHIIINSLFLIVVFCVFIYPLFLFRELSLEEVIKLLNYCIVTVQTVYLTAYLCVFTSTSREWTFLPHCLIRKVLCQTTYLQRRLQKQAKRF